MEYRASYINQYFDHVYVINLEKRPDRKITMLQKLGHLGIKAEFVRAIDGNSTQNKREHQHYLEQPIGASGSHPLEFDLQRKLIKSSGAWGYLKTYYGILKDAKKRGFERILCFDDDILFQKDFENQFRKAVQAIPAEWKLLYLGSSQYVWKIPQGLSYPDQNKKDIDSSEPFYFPNKTDGSFAMGINVSVFDLLISDILKMNCPFDSGPLRTVIRTFPKSCYVLNPNIVIADVSESDIREAQDQKLIAENLKWTLGNYDFLEQHDLISVIMPAYNAEKTIEKSVRSILLQSYQAIELIVVNDASSDNTVKIIEQLIVEDPRIRLISLPINKGVGHARNEGIKASKGEIIAFQDADDISLKHRIAAQLIPLYEKGMLFSVCRFYRSRCSMDELDLIDQETTISLVKSRRVQKKSGTYDYRDRSEIGLVTTIYKRSAFEQYGLFDEHRYGEDMEFLERILFYNTNQEFGENYNGHTFLSEHSSIPNLFRRIETALYVSSEMNEKNLTVQYQKKEKEMLLIEESFRNKYMSGGLDQFLKLSKRESKVKLFNFNFSTLIIDTIVMLPEVDHQLLLDLIKEANEKKKDDLGVIDIYDSLSWKITAPLRWFGKIIANIIR